MKFKYIIVSILLAALMALTACSSIPDLTPEQEEMVSEYATALLLKYDSENHSRLVDTTEYKETYEAAVAQYEAEKQAYYDAKQKEEDKRREEAMQQEAANSGSSSGSSDSSGSSGGASNDGTGGATVIDKSDIEEVLGLKGISLNYVKYELTDVYPQNEEDVMLTITASKGSKLLVIHFDVRNDSGNDQQVNFFAMDYPLKISVNSKDYKLPLHTLVLDDDINLFNGVIKAGDGKDLVLIFEVASGTEINKLNLRASYNKKSATRVLK